MPQRPVRILLPNRLPPAREQRGPHDAGLRVSLPPSPPADNVRRQPPRKAPRASRVPILASPLKQPDSSKPLVLSAARAVDVGVSPRRTRPVVVIRIDTPERIMGIGTASTHVEQAPRSGAADPVLTTRSISGTCRCVRCLARSGGHGKTSRTWRSMPIEP